MHNIDTSSAPRADANIALKGAPSLSISLVVYRPDVSLLNQTLQSVTAAWARMRQTGTDARAHLYIVDNGGFRDADIAGRLASLAEQSVAWTVLRGHGNVGYGRGHNLAIEQTGSQYHLILNPDIDMDVEALVNAFGFLQAHPAVGLVTPRIDDDRAGIQYLCRRYPAMLDLFVRGFLPSRLQRWFSRRLGRYEMRDVINGRDVVWDPPIVSGCFMFFRTGVLKRLAGFDPRYFLYFEDYDLSLRTHRLARVAYVPSVRAIHHGGGASRKGFAHIRMFVASAVKFYNQFGWKWV
ncbi:glycosyltransferase [Trinickia soli]|uniref:glycosyltransferase n=1 Tax=Trinickia soli TaxID=380675 RepID=UPI00125BCBCB|nr:glycosyltransferase [Paraburkholderia sp. T12-10]